MTMRDAGSALAIMSITLLTVTGCPSLVEVEEALLVEGALDRDSAGGTSDDAVVVDYGSSGARAEWWPCDVRLTAQGCVGEHHVNVYLSLPTVTSVSGVGQAACVSGDEAEGVYELFASRGAGASYALGADLVAFAIVASDVDDVPGAVFNDDAETTAASAIVQGNVRVTRWAGLNGFGLELDGKTAGGHDVSISFSGPASSPLSIATLESPQTCVARALVGG
ncbi:MAG: hypothetical protein ACO3JL_18055 [Myxococcota bacterium]